MPAWYVTSAALTGDVASLVLSSVDGLRAGWAVDVDGVGHPFDGHHTLTSVTENPTTCTGTITFAQNHANVAAYDVIGQVSVAVTWCDTADVEGFLGASPADATDVAWLDAATLAGNDWSYRRRQAAGYTTDSPAFPPSQSVKLGAILVAASLYRQRGSFGSYQQFDGLETTAVINSNVEILRMLGINRAVVA